MGLAGSLQQGEAQIWQIKLDNPIWDTFESVLSTDERERARRFRTEELQLSFSRCRSALRMVLGRYVNRPASELAFRYGEFGKPALVDQRLQFNVSHSGTYALIAVSCHPVGIDLEFMGKQGIDLPGLIEMVCHDSEKSTLASLGEQARSDMFYCLWSRKEAYAKMRGAGLNIPLPSLHFRPTDAPSMHEVMTEGGLASGSFTYDLKLIEGYSMSVCLPLPNAHIGIFHA